VGTDDEQKSIPVSSESIHETGVVKLLSTRRVASSKLERKLPGIENVKFVLIMSQIELYEIDIDDNIISMLLDNYYIIYIINLYVFL
jgi:hypothetical protein